MSVCLDDKNNEIYIFWRFSVELKHKIISGGSHFDDGYNLLPKNLLEEDDQQRYPYQDPHRVQQTSNDMMLQTNGLENYLPKDPKDRPTFQQLQMIIPKKMHISKAKQQRMVDRAQEQQKQEEVDYKQGAAEPLVRNWQQVYYAQQQCKREAAQKQQKQREGGCKEAEKKPLELNWQQKMTIMDEIVNAYKNFKRSDMNEDYANAAFQKLYADMIGGDGHPPLANKDILQKYNEVLNAVDTNAFLNDFSTWGLRIKSNSTRTFEGKIASLKENYSISSSNGWGVRNQRGQEQQPLGKNMSNIREAMLNRGTINFKVAIKYIIKEPQLDSVLRALFEGLDFSIISFDNFCKKQRITHENKEKVRAKLSELFNIEQSQETGRSWRAHHSGGATQIVDIDTLLNNKETYQEILSAVLDILNESKGRSEFNLRKKDEINRYFSDKKKRVQWVKKPGDQGVYLSGLTARRFYKKAEEIIACDPKRTFGKSYAYDYREAPDVIWTKLEVRDTNTLVCLKG